jgi:hypothetical protein
VQRRTTGRTTRPRSGSGSVVVVGVVVVGVVTGSVVAAAVEPPCEAVVTKGMSTGEADGRVQNVVTNGTGQLVGQFLGNGRLFRGRMKQVVDALQVGILSIVIIVIIVIIVVGGHHVAP